MGIYGKIFFIFLHITVVIIIACLGTNNVLLEVFFLEAVCSNQHFQKPTRSEFQVQFWEALRTAKERLSKVQDA